MPVGSICRQVHTPVAWMMPKTHWKGSYGRDTARSDSGSRMTGPGYPSISQSKPKKRPAWIVGGVTIVSFVVLLYVIELFDSLSGHRLDDNGIRPLETDGLMGIVFAPLLHANWDHLIANTVPALILGFLMTLAGMSRFIFATAIVWILGGLRTWLIDNIGTHCPYVGVRCESNHIGASGLIFGWLAFLIVFGFFTRKVWEIVVGVIVLLVYGSVLLGLLPGTPGVSWQGHVCGAIAGAIADQLPDEDIIYVGDTANGPYGPLTIPEIRAHALSIGDDLVSRGVKALVIACNTASSACLRDARERYAPVPVIEVILPAVRRAVTATRNGRIGVIGTAATIASGAYQDAFAAARDTEVIGVACPRFVDFVERGVTSGRQVLGLAEGYLEPLQRAEVDTLVLGCTHYPMLSGLIQLAMGDHVTLVSSAEETAKDLLRVLTELDLLRPHDAPQARRLFESTGDPEAFTTLAARFLGPTLDGVRPVQRHVVARR